MLLYKSLFGITLKLQKHKHIGIKENAEILVQCYCISSNNSRPSIIASLEYPLPPPRPSRRLLFLIPTSSSAMWSIKTDQWRINQGTKSGTLKKPCSVYLMWLFLDLMGKWNKIFRARRPVNNCWNNRLPRIIAFSRTESLPFCGKKEIITPGYYSRKYGIQNCSTGSTAFSSPEPSGGLSTRTRRLWGHEGHSIWSTRF